MSNIKVFVQWKSPTVSAGEEVECQITFKNISQNSNLGRAVKVTPRSQVAGRGRERWKESLPLKASPKSTGHNYEETGAHGPILSLNHPLQQNEAFISSIQPELKRSQVADSPRKRSVSIVSFAADASCTKKPYIDISELISKRHNRSHTRAASVHVLPSRNEIYPGLQSGNEHPRAFGCF